MATVPATAIDKRTLVMLVMMLVVTALAMLLVNHRPHVKGLPRFDCDGIGQWQHMMAVMGQQSRNEVA